MKQKLIENILVPTKFIEKVDTPIKEAVVGNQTYKALAVYRFPFTRPNQENLNGRIYPFALWDKVFSESPVTLSLVDHPEDGAGDPARVWAVLRNPGYSADKSLAYVDCYIIDNELGRTAYGVLQAGGTLGLSSSGYGDFEIDGKTICADSFELERYFDWVLEPSYSVFGSIEDVKNENVSDKNKDADNKKTESVKEGKPTMTLREKREFEASVKRIFEDIKNKPARERIERGKEALSFYEGVDTDVCKEDFETLVKEAEAEFEATIKKGESADELQKESDEYSKQVKEAEKEIEDLKKELDDVKKENDELKKAAEKNESFMKETDSVLKDLSENSRKSVTYDEYLKLREYAIRATKLYQNMKSDRNLLQLKVNELEGNIKTEKERQRQADAFAEQRRARQKQMEQQIIEKQASDEIRKRRRERQEFLSKVNPEVLQYYKDLKQSGEKVEAVAKTFLSKKTYMEAQLYWLKVKQSYNESKYYHNEMSAMQEEVENFKNRSYPSKKVENSSYAPKEETIAIPEGFI